MPTREKNPMKNNIMPIKNIGTHNTTFPHNPQIDLFVIYEENLESKKISLAKINILNNIN